MVLGTMAFGAIEDPGTAAKSGESGPGCVRSYLDTNRGGFQLHGRSVFRTMAFPYRVFRTMAFPYRKTNNYRDLTTQ